MEAIIQGMTPTEFVAALNTNFGYIPGSSTLTTDSLNININSNNANAKVICPSINLTDISSGISGSSFANLLNNNFNEVSDFGFVIEIVLSESTQITLPLINSANAPVHNLTVEWGDNSPLGYVTTYNDADAIHTYSEAGTYQIRITGQCDSWYCGPAELDTDADAPIKNYITKVIQWGNVAIKYFNFYGCSNLTIIPTDLKGAFSETLSMSYCFSLTGITTIPNGLLNYATKVLNLAQCFGGTNNIPETSKVTNIPAGLFDSCVNVTNMLGIFRSAIISEIPAGLFDNCTKITDISFAFKHNAGITVIPAGLLDNLTELTNIRELFIETNISVIPPHLLDHQTKVIYADYIFWKTKITSIPQGLFDYMVNLEDALGLFVRCYYLQSIPVDLFRYNVKIKNVEDMFHECFALAAIPSDIFAYNPLITSFYRTFRNCTNLSGNAPELWVSHPAATGTECFSLSTGLSNYNSIPSAWGGGGA